MDHFNTLENDGWYLIATIRKEILTCAPADEVWDAIRDIGPLMEAGAEAMKIALDKLMRTVS
ncbi:hypothetical protein V5F59_11505 [Xanthobacter autotrophicus DSM 431]|uniref:hypothetical protein n=1 Tax=Xanthobacter nonsaccharivorans TaxID=3119912 RepID=UPI00372B9A7E